MRRKNIQIRWRIRRRRVNVSRTRREKVTDGYVWMKPKVNLSSVPKQCFVGFLWYQDLTTTGVSSCSILKSGTPPWFLNRYFIGKEFFWLNLRRVFRERWIELTTRDPGGLPCKKNKGARRKPWKKNNKRFKDPVLWTWQEILDINSKTTYYLLSCRLGSTPAKAYCVLFESQHSKWYHKRLFNEHPRSLYMEPPPPPGGGGASIHLSTNLHEKHIAIHRISRMDNEGMFHHLATPSWLEINIITILRKIKRRTNIQRHTSVWTKSSRAMPSTSAWRHEAKSSC